MPSSAVAGHGVVSPSFLQSYAARLPLWVLCGAVLGVLTGLVLGERSIALRPVGIVYSMMIESVVYPYLFSSLVGGLGALAPSEAWRLVKASWPVYLFLWAIAFTAIMALGSAIPASPAPVEIIAGAPTAGAASFIDLFVPQNIFVALSRNDVPAVVAFFVAFGFAIQRVDKKATLIEAIEVIRRGSLAIWSWVVYLAPIGVFALFASTAGSIEPQAAEELAIYVSLFFIGVLILTIWIVPGAMTALAPLHVREILDELRPALVIAIVTTLSVAALPLIEKSAVRLLAKCGVDGEETADVVRATTSLSYVFVQVGNYFIGLFVLYASFLFKVPLTSTQHTMLPVMTLLSGIGSPSTTVEGVQFLAHWIGLPTETLPLYIESMAVTRYGQVIVSVMAIGAAAIAVPLLYFRAVAWRPGRMAMTLAVGAGAFVIPIGATRTISDRLFAPAATARLLERTIDPKITKGVHAIVHADLPPDLGPVPGAPTLQGIRERKTLRVGYGRDITPFTYRNRSEALVGFDMSYAYELARDLHVDLDFYPIDWSTVTDDLIKHRFDIVMAGAYLTDERLRRLAVTNPYFVSPLALITRSDRVDGFLTYDRVKSRSDLTVAVFRDPVLVPLVHDILPLAHVVTLESYDQLEGRRDVDAALWSLAQARSWASRHTGFTAVEPENMGSPLVFGYLLPPQSSDVSQFLNLWLSLHDNNGFRARQIAYWIDNSVPAARKPRWNLLDDVVAPAWWADHAR